MQVGDIIPLKTLERANPMRFTSFERRFAVVDASDHMLRYVGFLICEDDDTAEIVVIDWSQDRAASKVVAYAEENAEPETRMCFAA